MPYKVLKRGNGKKAFKIINTDTGKVVGSSFSREMALRSIKHREEYRPK